jgi:hypothetical protein
MIAVAMMQPSVVEVIQVIAVRDLHMAAIVMRTTAGSRSAGSRIGVAHLDDVFVVMIAVHGVQMPVVQVIRVITVLDGQMPAIGVVGMGMGGMCCVIHFISPSVIESTLIKNPDDCRLPLTGEQELR